MGGKTSAVRIIQFFAALFRSNAEQSSKEEEASNASHGDAKSKHTKVTAVGSVCFYSCEKPSAP